MKPLHELLISSKTMCRHYVIGALALLSFMVAIPIVASAQITTATIVGTVSDSSGAAVASASVTARNTETGLTRTVVSGEDGAFR